MALELRKANGSTPLTAAYDVHNASTCVVNALRSALYRVRPVVFGDAKVHLNSSTLTNEELVDRIMMIPIVNSTLAPGHENVTWELRAGNAQRFMDKTEIMSGTITFSRKGPGASVNIKPEFNQQIAIVSIRDRQEVHVTGRLVLPTESNGMYSTTIRPRIHTHEKKRTELHRVEYPLHRLEFEPKAHFTADENLRHAIDFLCEELESVQAERVVFLPAELQTIVTVSDTSIFITEMINSDIVSRGYHSSCYRANPDAPSTIRIVKQDSGESGEEVFRRSVNFLITYLRGKR